MDWKKTLLISLAILAAAASLTALIFMTEPSAERTTATKETAMLVDIVTVQRGDYQPRIMATGTVQAAQDIVLRPRVSGEIISRSPGFTPGGFVTKGDILLRIDSSDYENILLQRRSSLEQALADLNIEMGRQQVARKDYQLLDESLAEENEALVLRQPQLNAARSRVESARAAVKQAELNLERTRIRAPFDAHIISRNVNIGSQVSAGDNLGRLVGLNTYWVMTTVPLSKLNRIDIPEANGEKGSTVRVRNRAAWPAGHYRTGYVDKMIGALEDRTRMARLLVAVPDPLARSTNPADTPSLIIGSFLETEIEGKEISNVIRLNRDFVRKNNTVWTMQDSLLRIKNVNIVFQDAQYAYIDSGLNDADSVVTTNLTTVVEGARLRLPDKNGYDEDSSKATAFKTNVHNHDNPGPVRK